MSNGKAVISYHGTDRRDSRIIPLQSYGNPPAETKFDGLDYFDFRLNNVSSLSPSPLCKYSVLSVCSTNQCHDLPLQSPPSAETNHRAKARDCGR